MSIALQITFHNLAHSDAVEDHVRRRVERLSALAKRVLACHVAVEAPHKSKVHGRHYRVRLDLTTPGAEVIVDRCPDAGRACEDVHSAIDHAFDHAARKLRERMRRGRPEHLSDRR